jgi:valyl-tRNA synthetase
LLTNSNASDFSSAFPDVYDAKEVERGWYEFWKEGGFFTAGTSNSPRFSLVFPPPNVTGRFNVF